MSKDVTFEELKEKRLITTKQVLQIIPVTRSTLWYYVKQNKVPAPIKIGNKSFWKAQDIYNFIENRGKF